MPAYRRGSHFVARGVQALALISLLVAAQSTQAAIPTSERTTLMELYNSTNGWNWRNNTGWNGLPGTECGWYGVSCDSGLTSIVSIQLSSNNLTGTLPSLTTFSNLQFFGASQNSLTGSIPALTGLTNLVYFEVQYNQLTGPVPQLIGLTSLFEFDAYKNRLTGAIPALAGLTRLSSFNVDSNQLSGAIPTLTGLINLNYFDVGYNQLTGSLPALDGLSNLQSFSVYNNRLNGPVPSLTGLAILQFLDVGANQLSGTLPTAPTTLQPGQSQVCPNRFDPTPDPGWDRGTGITPWYVACANSTFTVTPSAGSNGTISPNTPITVGNGDTATFSIAADAGYAASVSGSCGGNLIGNTYTTNAITADCSIVAAFNPLLAPTVTTLVSLANPSSEVAEQVFTARVAGAQPTGKVTFIEGTAMLCNRVALAADFTAVCATGLTAGSHVIGALYSGDSRNAVSTATLTQIVVSPSSATPTTLTLTSSANPSIAGQAVSFTSSVVGNAPTGKIYFSSSSSLLCEIDLTTNGNSATATCATSTLAPGLQIIRASYSGNLFNASSDSPFLYQQVQSTSPSRTILTSSANPGTQGQAIEFKATVLGAVPYGNVVFTDAGKNLCDHVSLSPISGEYVAYCVAIFDDTSTHSVTASYGGDPGNAPSSDILVQSVAPTAPVNPNQFGMTGSWYNPATSGQGVEVEVIPDYLGIGKGILFAGWFTYDTALSVTPQRWYVLQGTLDSLSPTASLGIYQTIGGNFDAPPKIAATNVGNAMLVFADCTHATLRYAFNDGSARSGSIPLTRLSAPTSCSAVGDNGVTGTDFFLSGAWYATATSGQGILLDVSPTQTTLFGAWYTYAQNGENIGNGTSQRWFTLQTNSYVPGSHSAKSIPIYTSALGLFDDPTPIANTQIGMADITFTSCSSMSLTYHFTSGEFAGQSNTITMTPTGPVPAGCK
jgi:hypothetical protein